MVRPRHIGETRLDAQDGRPSSSLRNIPRADRPCPRRRRGVEVHRQQPNQQHQPSIGARMSLMSYWVFSWVNKLLAAWEYAIARPRHLRLRGPRTSQNLRRMLSHRHSDFSKSQGAGSFRLGRQPSAEHPHLLGGFIGDSAGVAVDGLRIAYGTPEHSLAESPNQPQSAQNRNNPGAA